MPTASNPANQPTDPRSREHPLSEATTAARLQRLAPTLKEAELRTALCLATAAENSPQHTCRISTRDLATATHLERRNLQYALHSLTARGLITRRAGTPTTAAGYLINFLDTIQMGGVAATPPLASQQPLPGVDTTPPLASLRRHPGVFATPPPNPESATSGDHAALDPMYDTTKALDRVLRARPKDFPPDQIKTARGWLVGYRRELNREDLGHPPDDYILAQFLAVAPWAELERMLKQLFNQGIKAGEQDAWFVTVALNRIHGIAPAAVSKRRDELKLVPSKQQKAQEDQAFGAALTRQLTAKVGGLA